MWTAAIASPTTQTMFISLLAKWINATPTNRAFTDLYNTQTGEYVLLNFFQRDLTNRPLSFADGPFIARPVVGGHFALLALNGAPTEARKKREEFRA